MLHELWWSVSIEDRRRDEASPVCGVVLRPLVLLKQLRRDLESHEDVARRTFGVHRSVGYPHATPREIAQYASLRRP